MYNNSHQLLEDILESIRRIFDYTNNMTYESFLADNKTIDAVIRNFEIIGEATAKLSDEFKEKHEHINWHRLRGMRNRIAHDYRNVNIPIIWETIQNDLEELLIQIKKLK
jgi:uncharacterized protein with HEPN domain